MPLRHLLQCHFQELLGNPAPKMAFLVNGDDPDRQSESDRSTFLSAHGYFLPGIASSVPYVLWFKLPFC